MTDGEQERQQLDSELLESIAVLHRRSYPQEQPQSVHLAALLALLDSPEGQANPDSPLYQDVPVRGPAEEAVRKQ